MNLARLCAPLRHAHVLAVGQVITLDAGHLRALVFRKVNTKEAFTIMDFDGRYFRASLTSVETDTGQAIIYEAMTSSPESPAHIALFCAVLGRQRMLGVIQKATELGVMAVVPFLSERSVPQAGLAHEKAHAWPAQALRAARQCRRASIPKVSEAVTFELALNEALFRDADQRFYLDDRAPTDSCLPASRTTERSIVLVVGPEGGFTDDERASLMANHAVPLRLGERVLRAETSALVGLALLQHHYGDMG
jgi:16S rRNA (uracil1498-N3)-methyltransferase